ncbi:MAG: transglycosylase SLT domain-containing protein, partial [Acidimicrobiales bacterium]
PHLLVLVLLLGAGVAAVALIWGDDQPEAATQSAAVVTTTEAPTTTLTPTTPPLTEAASVPAATTPTRPVAAGDPVGLAAQINRVERVLHDPATPEADLAAAAMEQQVAYRKLVATPEWKAEVTALVDAANRPWLEKEFLAGSKLRSMIKKPKDSLPKWRIVAPAPAAELLGYYQEAEAEFGVPWTYLAAINLVETRMGRIRGVSSAGAQGPMQFMPPTWAAYGGGGDVNSNRDAIMGAARYLKANGAPGDMRNALWNYNHHFAYVDAVSAHAERMAEDPGAFRAYHGWQVLYVTVNGDEWLHEGWENTGS